MITGHVWAGGEVPQAMTTVLWNLNYLESVLTLVAVWLESVYRNIQLSTCHHAIYPRIGTYIYLETINNPAEMFLLTPLNIQTLVLLCSIISGASKSCSLSFFSTHSGAMRMDFIFCTVIAGSGSNGGYFLFLKFFQINFRYIYR